MCQLGRWATKGVDWRVPRRLEEKTSTNEHAGPRTEVDCEIPHRVERKTKHILVNFQFHQITNQELGKYKILTSPNPLDLFLALISSGLPPSSPTTASIFMESS